MALTPCVEQKQKYKNLSVQRVRERDGKKKII